jgi:hypothetical protein
MGAKHSQEELKKSEINNDIEKMLKTFGVKVNHLMIKKNRENPKIPSIKSTIYVSEK